MLMMKVVVVWEGMICIMVKLSLHVVATTYHKGQMISLMSKPQKKYDVGIHKRTRQGVSA